MNAVAREEGICPHTHLLPPSLSFPSCPQSVCTYVHGYTHTGLKSCGGHPGGDICELWGSAEPLSRAEAVKNKSTCNMKEFLQFTRGSGTSERRCLNSQCALLGEVSKLGWLLLLLLRLADASPSLHRRRRRRPTRKTALHPTTLMYFFFFDGKCTSCSPLHRRDSVTSETSVKHVQPECRHPPRAAQGPSGASL